MTLKLLTFIKVSVLNLSIRPTSVQVDISCVYYYRKYTNPIFIPCAHVFDPFFLIPEIQAYKEVDPKYLTLAGSKDFTFGIYRDNPINSQ